MNKLNNNYGIYSSIDELRQNVHYHYYELNMKENVIAKKLGITEYRVKSILRTKKLV